MMSLAKSAFVLFYLFGGTSAFLLCMRFRDKICFGYGRKIQNCLYFDSNRRPHLLNWTSVLFTRIKFSIIFERLLLKNKINKNHFRTVC